MSFSGKKVIFFHPEKNELKEAVVRSATDHYFCLVYKTTCNRLKGIFFKFRIKF